MSDEYDTYDVTIAGIFIVLMLLMTVVIFRPVLTWTRSSVRRGPARGLSCWFLFGIFILFLLAVGAVALVTLWPAIHLSSPPPPPYFASRGE